MEASSSERRSGAALNLASADSPSASASASASASGSASATATASGSGRQRLGDGAPASSPAASQPPASTSDAGGVLPPGSGLMNASSADALLRSAYDTASGLMGAASSSSVGGGGGGGGGGGVDRWGLPATLHRVRTRRGEQRGEAPAYLLLLLLAILVRFLACGHIDVHRLFLNEGRRLGRVAVVSARRRWRRRRRGRRRRRLRRDLARDVACSRALLGR